MAGISFWVGSKGSGGRPVAWLRRLWRKLGLRRQRKLAKLVYDPGYERTISGVPMDCLRADRILAFLSNEGLIERDEIVIPEPADVRAILLAHTHEYIESLQDPAVLGQILGVGVNLSLVDEVQEFYRLATGGTIEAVRLALDTGAVAVNLGGGFHHAEPSRGMGFCVFNDITIAISCLRESGFADPILVVDLDLHDGNGTRAAFAKDPSVFTFSIHNQDWGAKEAVASTSIALGAAITDEPYLEALRASLPAIVEGFRPKLFIYLAGCDGAADDRIGNWRISPAGLFERDLFVTKLARQARVPLAIVLAGGYGEQAWRHTARYLAWLISGNKIEPPATEGLTLMRFRQIKAQLDPVRLVSDDADDDWGLSEDDIVGLVPVTRRHNRFLDYFSVVGIELLLEQFGIFDLLRSRGFVAPAVRLDLDHPLGQTVRVFGDGECEELLIELRVSRSKIAVPDAEVLVVEWLLLQNPRLSFTSAAEVLPGQRHPGLGMLSELFSWLVVVCETAGLDGIYFRPSHYHVAAVGRRFACFVDPKHEGLFCAIALACGDVPLVKASRSIEMGRLLHADTHEVYRWEGYPMFVPVSPRLQTQYAVNGCEESVGRADEKARFEFRNRSPRPRSVRVD